jgi:hypothetical protein
LLSGVAASTVGSMVAPVSVHKDQLTRLVALSPGDDRLTALVRRVCAQALSLPPLPAEVAVDGLASEAETTVAEFAEQFSVDVSVITDEQRSRLWKALATVLSVLSLQCISPTLCLGCAPAWKR